MMNSIVNPALLEKSGVKKAVILVAGFGTRFLPATKAQPKEMLPLVDKPAIQYLVEEVVASGIKDIIFVTGRGKRAIEDHFDRAIELERFLEERGKSVLAREIREIASSAHFSFIRQKEPRGTGDALLHARPLIGREPVAVLYGDDIVISKKPCVRQLIDIYEKYKAPVMALERVARKEVSRYGVIAGDKVGPRLYKVKELVEKPPVEKAPSNLIRIGKAILTPEIFDILSDTAPPAKGEFYDTVALKKHMQDGGALYGYEYEGLRYDCGEKLGFLKASVHAGLQHPETRVAFRSYLKKLKF